MGALCLALSGSSFGEGTGGGEWVHFGGGLDSNKYSPLDQIDASNVSDLEIAWRWNVRDVEEATGEITRGFRVTPLVVGGRMYLSTGLNLVVAMDPASGELIWTYDPKAYDFPTPTHGGLGSRGVEYWTDGDEERIIMGTGGLQLIALDAKTGTPFLDFGDNGVVDLSIGLGRPIQRSRYNVKSPAVVCRDTIVIGSVVNDLGSTKLMPPGHIRGYDVRTGEMKWIFHTIPQEGEFGVETWGGDSWKYTGNTNVWSLMSADEELGYVYLPIGTPTNDWYGGHRPGDNLFAESLVCLNAETGERVWHFQAVHHGTWDYDFPCAPNLIDIVVDGKPIKAVAQVSKQAFTYVFDRVTGEPIWPIEERPVSTDGAPGEARSPTQPFPTKPPAFDRQGVSEEDLIDFTPELRAEALEIVEDFVIGPLFTPTIVRGAGGKDGLIQVPGIIGGANSMGASFDPETGLLYVKSVTLPWVTSLATIDPNFGDMRYRFDQWARYPPGPQGLPLLKPPYARLTALDMNRGEIAWQIPFGDGPREKVNAIIGDGTDVGPLGSTHPAAINTNGLLVTKTLLFANEAFQAEEGSRQSSGGVLRAYDKATGREVWRRDVEMAPNGPPMTYMHRGKQYYVFTASTRTGSGVEFELLAYALP